MALETYRRKRDFEKTTEPKGTAKPRKATNSFVVQKHDARRLHYDFRLEMNGVLLSWAVTKGPSLVPGEKRLAVQTEDHPLEYGDFEGTIPEGEYGGGTVMLWDRGTWTPIGDVKKGYAKGHIDFEVSGEKLNGRWHLVRMAKRPREKRENWLLIKGDDEFSREEGDPDILEERPLSVKTGRDLSQIAKEAPGWSSKTGKIEDGAGRRSTAKAKTEKAKSGKKATSKSSRSAASDLPKGSRKAKRLDFVEPQLATLRPEAPAGARWVHEIKFDGYRLQAHLSGGTLRLLTRSGLDWTRKFGKPIAEAFGKLQASDAVIDGELVVEAGGGASDFSALQADLSDGRTDRFAFYAFDLLYLDGYDLRSAALIDRKETLAKLIAGAPARLRYSDHFEEDGDLILRHACRLSLEGVVSKLRDGKYRSGRGKDWIKSKCSDRQEFVIAGYVPSTTSDTAIGSLVLGHYDGKTLVHAGRVGTGFSRKVANDLFRKLEDIRRDKAPFDAALDTASRRGVRFVEPQLVAEVEFRAWTADGILRHAAFRGLREDKPPAEIIREDKKAGAETLPRWTVKLTHPDRIYWKDAGVTKEGLAEYYSQAWRFMAPFLVNRPLALLRCPNGIDGQCFFQKHSWKGMSQKILTLHDPQDKSGQPIVAIDGFDGLIGLVQGGVLEIHPWQASADDLERPDQIVMDLDPGDGVEWVQVIDAANEVRERMEAAGFACFLKTSGGKGLHVVSPVKPSAGWEEIKGFAKGIADAMAGDSPDRFVSTITKSKRRGKILIDYLRNGRGATAVAPYSTRSREGAPVSMPLAWEELAADIGPAYFAVPNAPVRLANLNADPWADFRKAEVPLGARSSKFGGKKKRTAA